MLYIHQSNQQEQLLHVLTELLKRRQQASLTRQTVLVQSPGMAQWLKMGIATSLGVCSAIDFPLPSTFIWRLYQQNVEDVPEQSAFNKDRMQWKLFRLLRELDQPVYQPLQQYLSERSTERDRFSLAGQIADLFDQYLMYRPDWLEQWLLNHDVVDNSAIASEQLWQPALWRRLVLDVQALGQNASHRANLQQQFLSSIATRPPVGLPEQIHLFGISALAPNQLLIFESLAKYMDVHLYLLNPTEHYWGDVLDEKTAASWRLKFGEQRSSICDLDPDDYLLIGNPLLASWGKLGRDYLELLLQSQGQWFDYFQASHAPNNLLSAVQHDIFELSYRGEQLCADSDWLATEQGIVEIAADDQSIVLAQCHSAMRELEALRDHILDLLVRHPALTPNDIIVMMPDVGQYSPFIRAVFSQPVPSSKVGVQKLPFAISDMAIEQENPLLTAFLSLLTLPHNRCQFEQVFDWLELPAVMARFELNEFECEQLKRWSYEAGARWGLVATNKAQWQLPASPLHTWSHSLSRLILGLATADDSQAYAGLYPFSQVEGQQAILLAILNQFLQTLLRWQQQLSGAHTLLTWQQQLNQLLDELFLAVDDRDLQSVQAAREAIAELAEHQILEDYQQSVSIDVMLQALRANLKQKGVGQRFMAGSINFCTLMPMRSVPFKVVCLLGLNDGDYPRQVAPLGFDLIQANQSRKGDRSRRLDDRYLLLEALLSTRQQLYLSYISHSARDNSERYPSVLLAEFIDYLRGAYRRAGQTEKQHVLSAVTREHRLQPFAESYFTPGPMQSFNQIYCPTPVPPIGQAQTQQNVSASLLLGETAEISEIDFAELLKFAKHSLQYHLQRQLKVRFSRDDQQIDNDEPFSIDALTQYQLAEQYAQCQNVSEQQHLSQYWQQTGVLPAAWQGELSFAELDQKFSRYAEQLRPWQSQHAMRRELQLSLTTNAEQGLHSLTITGWLQPCFQDVVLLTRPAAFSGSDYVLGWLTHLAISAMGAGRALVIGSQGSLSFKAIAAADASRYLQPWVNAYFANQQQPICQLPSAHLAYGAEQDSEALAKLWPSSEFKRGLDQDRYLQACYPDVSQLPESFFRLHQQLWLPLFAHVEVSK